MKPPERRTYLLIERIEKKRCGLCGQITDNERMLSCELAASINTVRSHLKDLAAHGWIEYVPGQAILKDGKGTTIRRRTIAEVKTGNNHAKIVNPTPEDARFLCEIFNARSFTYDSQAIRPRFAAQSTGRIYTSQPNTQGDSQSARLNKANTGILPGQFACEVDYRQADATTIRMVLDRQGLLAAQDWPEDIYEHFGKLIGCSRNDAKSEVNHVFYARKSRVFAGKLCPCIEKHDFAIRLADSLDTFKAILWDEGRPIGRRTAHVKTVGGTLIEGLSSEKKRTIHQGMLLSWMIQGTVSDALNKAARELVEKEKEQGWRVLFPVHDAVMMLCPDGKSNDIQAIMEKNASVIGVPLKTKVVR